MLHNNLKFLLFVLLTLLLSGCLNEDTQPQKEEQSVMGPIVLNLSGIEVFTDEGTRAAQTLDDYTGYVFTLNGTAVESGTVTNQVITLDGTGSAIIEAGTYTLTASNLATSQTGNGCPYYNGTSAEFTLSVGGTQSVSIGSEEHPLTPQNVKLTIVYDDDGDDTARDTFAELYGSGTFTVGTRTVNLTSGSTVAYFPVGAGTVNYTLAAPALSGSHVTDITAATGSISVEAGKAYTLTLKADPVSGELIPVVSGTHTGKFD
jgi:hypothetical protein